ncbi:M1 family metallopeptidase [Lutibacter holmesii]|uniref:M1 family metallopeptidase n=1 Tax=Lutibacter holmesii TaxID=1137985 RepID=A0ABW3WKV2_9FLAO
MKKIYLSMLLFLIATSIIGQHKTFTRQDTLRGSITEERAWWNLNHYTLDIQVQPENKFISGKNSIKYTVLSPLQTMQVDLQYPLNITKVTQDNKELFVENIGDAYFVKLEKAQLVGDKNEIIVYYEGNPIEAKNAPWDGGLTWGKDENNIDFIATSCQGIGASIWWPCKDHMYDEPESMDIYITVPEKLTAISNGRLTKVITNKNSTKTFHWFVNNPINNYGVNMNIGDYVHFSEEFKGELGNLDCDYYVLSSDLEKAKKQFKQVPKMLEAFEYWFGPYPFYADSYKLVQVPYLGMEHQSSVTYGNKFRNGYLGTDISETGWGLKFDFIIIHESGHEWFANNITYKDIADMWIHESFTAYSESLFLNYHYGIDACNEYVIGTRKSVRNDKPIIGIYNVNEAGSGDMYYKGANMLHTLRQIVNNDDKWRQLLRGLNTDFYHQTVTTKQIETYISTQLNLDLSAFFNQYLRDIRIPTLEVQKTKNQIEYRWNNVVANFNMPIKVLLNSEEKWISPTNEWKQIKLNSTLKKFKVDKNFYVEYLEVN